MKKILTILFLAGMVVAGAFAGGRAEARPFTIVWYPNESGEDLKGARDAFAAIIEAATGRTVEHRLTTDYVIAIEAIANNKADLGFFGATGYIEANLKNPKVQPLVVNSGASGTLSDALYYSWLIVRHGEEGTYRAGADFSIDNIRGKRMSWVSTSSTSGFVVPSSGIVDHFKRRSEWATLKADDLLEGGANRFFSQVLFGASHQGAAVNLLTERADIAAVCDTCVFNYVELVSGTASRPGALYRVRRDAVDPFAALAGKQFVIIRSVPVLNAPFVINTATVSAQELAALRTALVADTTAKNEMIFVPRGAPQRGLFRAGQRFLPVEDAWFQPIRDLSK